MSAIEILYIVFLIWSLAFGLEAMLIGLGGKLIVLYHRARAKTFGIALVVGLAIVVPAIVTSIVFKLEPIYFAVLVLAYGLVAGETINLFGSGRVKTTPPPPMQEPSEGEIEAMVRKRGLGKLVRKKKDEKRLRKEAR